MKRTTALSALVASAALLLAGCGSGTATSGSAAPAAVSQAGTGSDSGSTAGGAATDSSAGGSATDTSAGGGASDSATNSSATDSSATDSSATDSSATDSTATDSTAADTSAADSSATDSTAGAGSGGPSSAATGGASVTRTLDAGGNLDPTTTQWFDTFCSAAAPLADVATAMKSGGSSDPAKLTKTLGDIYSKMGAAFTDSAAKLKDVPPPTFPGGEDFAKKAIAAYAELGPKLAEAGKKLSAADPKDPNAMKVLEDLGSTMQSGMAPLQDLQKLKLSDATTAAIKKIPSCQKIMSMGG